MDIGAELETHGITISSPRTDDNGNVLEKLEASKTQNFLLLSQLMQKSLKDLGYNLRSGSLLMLPQAKTTTYGTSSLTFRGSILWNSLPDAIKSSPSVVYFKRSIKEWKGENCTCKNCC